MCDPILFDVMKSNLEAATKGFFIKKAALKHFAIFTGKNLCWSFFLIKLQAEWTNGEMMKVTLLIN